MLTTSATSYLNLNKSKINLVVSSVTLMLYAPEKSVIVASLVPFAMTVTHGRPSPSSPFVTVPIRM